MADLRIILSPGVTMEFVRIPAGSFLMGSRGFHAREAPVHRVRISQGFYLGVTPVTQAQFAVWTAERAIEHENRFSGNAENPAENMDWNEAVAYCEWLTQCQNREDEVGSSSSDSATGIPPGYVAGLPSEAQWEYACRGGAEQSTAYSNGDGEAALAEVGWYDGNSAGQTQPVGEKEPNGLGLYDMHGNVWEWCRDVWDADAYKYRVDGVCDPETIAGERTGKDPGRVFRGGSWFYCAGSCRCACRDGRRPGYRFGDQGFRVGLFAGPSCQQQQESHGAQMQRARRDDAAAASESNDAAGKPEFSGQA